MIIDNLNHITKKYDVIYADPPWSYSDNQYGRGVKSHYHTMTYEDIKSLPIANIVSNNAVLFIWCPMCKLEGIFEIIHAWGFTYKTMAFVWVKQTKKSDKLFTGLGHWTRANAELCLLATRGRPKCKSHHVHQVVISHIQAHSKKPDKIRDNIALLLDDDKYITSKLELFARQTYDGWDSYGDEL